MAAEPTPRAPILEARGLGILAGTTVLLEDISFALAPGAVLVLVGETGAGKSSLLDALSGMSPHVLRGELAVLGEDGRRRGSLAPHRGRRLGVLQQDVRGWYTPYRRVGTQILEGWGLDPVAGRDRVARLLERFALPVDRIWSRYPNQLSDGMLRRAALAGLLAREPALVIADEPTAGLDGPTRWRAWELLLESGAAVVAATHDLEQIATLSAQGRILRTARISGRTLRPDAPDGEE